MRTRRRTCVNGEEGEMGCLGEASESGNCSTSVSTLLNPVRIHNSHI